METRHSDNDGSDIFWPGYVDATTNLILNLLFLLTILIVAVFMFALELGRTSPGGTPEIPLTSTTQKAQVVSKDATVSVAENTALKREIERLKKMLAQQASAKKEAKAVSKEATVSVAENMALKREIERLKIMLAQQASAKEEAQAVSKEATVSVAENMVLKREIERLKMMLAQRASQNVQSAGLVKSVDATSNMPKPQTGLDKTLAGDLEIMVRFKDEAVAFTPAERERLLESLKPIVASGKTSIYVEVPVGFSEAKRMGFYRAMAVRNLLIEMKLPKENIDVSVVEGKNNADASLVRVRPF